MIHVISVINVTNNCINISLVYLLLFFFVSLKPWYLEYLFFFSKIKMSLLYLN